jgi:hypothetical protein
MAIRVRLSALIAASALVLIAGCGGGSDEGVADLSATKILAAAKKQLDGEKFVTIKGKGVDKEAGGEIAVDLSFAGETATGSIGAEGMTLKLLKAGGKSYFKADKSFFESAGAPADAISLIGDKWVVIDANDPSFAEIGSFIAKKDFFKELLKPDGKVAKGKEKKVNGVDCVALKAKDGTFYFDKKDGRPVSLVAGASGKGTLDFSYDKIDKVEAPSSDDVIDLATLGQ